MSYRTCPVTSSQLASDLFQDLSDLILGSQKATGKVLAAVRLVQHIFGII